MVLARAELVEALATSFLGTAVFFLVATFLGVAFLGEDFFVITFLVAVFFTAFFFGLFAVFFGFAFTLLSQDISHGMSRFRYSAYQLWI